MSSTRDCPQCHRESGFHTPDCTLKAWVQYSPPDTVEAKHDAVNHPKHYTSSPAKCSSCGTQIECIDVVRHMPFNLGNAVKYLWRAELKNAAVEDLKKAAWYIADEIARRSK